VAVVTAFLLHTYFAAGQQIMLLQVHVGMQA